MPRRVPVTYLFSRACPSHEEGLDLLRDAARATDDVDLDIELVEVRTDEDAERLRFAGSPTYLVRGRDPFAAQEQHAFRMDSCRAYPLPSGRVGPLPDPDELAAALRAGAEATDHGESR